MRITLRYLSSIFCGRKLNESRRLERFDTAGLALTPNETNHHFLNARAFGERCFTCFIFSVGVRECSFMHFNGFKFSYSYVAPEYAMTGHLLVKSDVYSYGVVLLELLTGRKPVDMSRPAGQENLVTWARPLLTSADGLDEIIDPSLDAEVQFDSVAKVAAIASMCVQPEVSHRPFMGEVVQALKLVCSECNSQERYPGPVGDISNGAGMEAERILLSDMFGTSPMSSGDEHGSSFHRHSCSGPLTTGKSKQFWQRLRSLRTGSMSDHGLDSLGLEAHSVGSGHGR